MCQYNYTPLDTALYLFLRHPSQDMGKYGYQMSVKGVEEWK